MIHLALPLGTTHGWGVVGRMLARELARLAPLRFYTEPLHLQLVEDELELSFLGSLLPPAVDPQGLRPGGKVDGPVLRGIPSLTEDYFLDLRGTFNVGYLVFEDDLLAPLVVQRLRQQFDMLVTGSTWCADALRAGGCDRCAAILQGIDPQYFNPTANQKKYFPDHFVVFSGGKLEFRKGQDLVIRAYQVLQQRHKDVMLVNAWYNPFPATAGSIGASKHIRVPNASGDHATVINALLANNDIDLARVITVGPRPNPMMPYIYKNTDIGLFTNRCEGATNLVLCEYMACGKPVIASFNTGHRDILTDDNSIPLRDQTMFTVNRDQKPAGQWFESNLEEVIEKLEWAYQNRGNLAAIGVRAGEDQSKLTWAATARSFLKILNQE